MNRNIQPQPLAEYMFISTAEPKSACRATIDVTDVWDWPRPQGPEFSGCLPRTILTSRAMPAPQSVNRSPDTTTGRSASFPALRRVRNLGRRPFSTE